MESESASQNYSPGNNNRGKNNSGKKVVIIGAGPAGLTAAYELSKEGLRSVVLEKDSVVGGISRTVNYKGYRFDIGGHRFFTKVRVVEDMWKEIMGDDFLKRKRLSRIYYKNTFFYYPFRLPNALWGLGIGNSIMIVLSYIKSQLFPFKPEDTFDKWVSNRFGKRLYELFFKTYTEKVWGIPCEEISAEWAAQRIKGLSLLEALKNALIQERPSDRVVKTLIDSFHYPKLGPGMMWEKVSDTVSGENSEVILNADVEIIYTDSGKVDKVDVLVEGKIQEIEGSEFISSMPIRELIQKLEPQPPKEVSHAADMLKYRDFLTVSLIINKKNVFPDNWIYIHDPRVKMGRIQNFKNWSPDMVPDQEKTCLGLEYFCFEGDGLWTMGDRDLINLARKELEIMGLVDAHEIEDGSVVRMPKAYPVYDSTYLDAINIIRDFLSQFRNLQLVGRNGMHKYNNQDHSMLTAMLAVKNILGGNYDLWKVNADQEYHEEVLKDKSIEPKDYKELSKTQPLVPVAVAQGEGGVEQTLISVFAGIDKLALALSVGAVSGGAIFIATILLILKGGSVVGPNLLLLNQYFIGYSVSIEGAFIGLGYSFLWGFIFGWLFAYLRNLLTGFYIYRVKKSAELSSFRDFIDYI
jgi:protoporphyrinogen oxidase